MELRFTQAARRHRIGRARARHVIEHPYAVVRSVREGLPDVLMHLGDDHTGRALEVGVVEDDGVLLVIHANWLQNKHREAYESGKREKDHDEEAE